MDDAGKTYVLITQCLQNDFLFNLNCRLRLPEDAAGKLLIGAAAGRSFGRRDSRRVLDRETVLAGPLGRLLAATAGARRSGAGDGVLHLVNIRDWHLPSTEYDFERQAYGGHCEAGTWGADYPDALLHLLDPTGDRHRTVDRVPPFDPAGTAVGSLRVHHVHSNTLFDFRPDESGGRSELHEVLSRIITPENRENVRVAVVGVYTDIKVTLLLQGMRNAVPVGNIVVSDSLTASPTLERHLAALDFADKVLRVEVMHGVAELARFLGSGPADDEELESLTGEVDFADFRQYFRDRQRIVSHEDTQLQAYRRQVAGRLRRTVRLVNFTNAFLIGCGTVTAAGSVLVAVVAATADGRVPVALPAAVLAVCTAQLVSLFFRRPADGLLRLLGAESVYRMLLESRSLRLALARHHLTAPDALHPTADSRDRTELLEQQLALLANLDRADFDRFESLGVDLQRTERQ